MRNRLLLLCLCSIVVFSCRNQEETKVIDGWTILFDGSSYNQWRGFQKEEVPQEWTIEGEAMAFVPGDEGGKTILTKKKYTNFTLSLEWKISKNGNSGVFWGVDNDEKYAVAYQTGPEIQIRDNEIRQDTLVLKIHRAGAIFGIMPPSDDLANPVGSWNHCLIDIDHKANKGRVEMNGEEILSFPVNGQDWKQLWAKTKFVEMKGFGETATGYIGLQDHGDAVWYRNIKIKEK